MDLRFSQKINGKPTHFVEKIWSGLDERLVSDVEKVSYMSSCALEGFFENGLINYYQPKIHTIRKDEKNRWKEGSKIHFVTGKRWRGERFQFAPVLSVLEIQEIRIDEERNVFISDNVLLFPDLKELALNDGFDSVKDFFDYFKEPFEGKLIHWTGKTY